MSTPDYSCAGELRSEFSAADAASSEFESQSSFPRRYLRRLRGWFTHVRSQRAEPDESPFEAAFAWLMAHCPDGVPAGSPDQPPCRAATGAAIATAIELGANRRAQHWCQLLASGQQADGGFPDAAGRSSRLHTGQALRGLLSCVASSGAAAPTELVRASQKAAAFLHSQIDAQGVVNLMDAPPGSLDRFVPPTLQVAWLPSLLTASRQLGEPRWETAVQRCLAHYERCYDLTRWNCPSHVWANVVEAFLDLGRCDLARAALRLPSARQYRDGSLPALPRERWVSSAGMAQLAVCGYRLGALNERHMADRALAALTRRQSRSGGFRGSWGPRARYYVRSELPHAARLFLEARLWQARSAFTHGEGAFPAEILADDGRLRAVVEWSQTLQDGSRIADVGCGKGRFLRHLLPRRPKIHLTGIDVSSADLLRLPPQVERRCGSLLQIPAANGEFDAAMCVEALEHALLPRRALAELCRIVRPGGTLLMIDKNRAYQPLSDHEPWERWFTGEEVCRWLAEECEDVSVRAIAHGPHRAPCGLFWCWTARRRRLAAERSAA